MKQKNKFPTMAFIKTGISTLAGYAGSRMIANKIGERYPDKKEIFELLVSAGITGAGAYYYNRIPKEMKSIGTGFVIGSGINTTIKMLSVPQIKSKLPSSVTAMLGGFGNDMDDSKVISYEDYQKQIDDEVNNRLALEQIESNEDLSGAEEEIELSPEQVRKLLAGEQDLSGADEEEEEQEFYTSENQNEPAEIDGEFDLV